MRVSATLPPSLTLHFLVLRGQDTKQAAVADGEERRWMHRGTLDSFTYWKHDEKPTEDDALLKVIRWASVASVLHADHGEVDEVVAIE